MQTAALPSTEDPNFGSSMWSLCFRAIGSVSTEQARELAASIVKAMGMNIPPFEPAVWEYPVCGKGGTGVTLVQPLTESFLEIDTYPDWCFVFLNSCIKFEPKRVYKACSDFGLMVNITGGYFREVK